MKKYKWIHLSSFMLAILSAVSCNSQQIDGGEGSGSNGTATSLSVGAIVDQTAAVRASGEGDHNSIGTVDASLGAKFSGMEVFVGTNSALDGTNGVVYRQFNLLGINKNYELSRNLLYPTSGDTRAAIQLHSTKAMVNVMLNADLTEEGNSISQWVRQAGSVPAMRDRWFREKYDLNAMNLNAIITTSHNPPFFLSAPKTAVSKVAKEVSGYDQILATSANYMFYPLTPDVSATQTVSISAPNDNEERVVEQNRFVRTLYYVAARALVTSSQHTTMTPYTISNGTRVLGRVKNLRYVVGQGERAIFLGRPYLNASRDYFSINATNSTEKPSDFYGTDKDVIYTPSYDYDAVKYDATSPADSGAFTYYDYATLWMDPNSTGGTLTVNRPKQLKAGQPVVGKPGGIGTADDYTSEIQEDVFFLPVTHRPANDKTSGYRKGNTPYALVRGQFTPATFADEGQSLYLSEQYTSGPAAPYKKPAAPTTVGANTQTLNDPPGTFYYTSNGDFFHTLEGAIKSFNATRVPDPTETTLDRMAGTYTEDDVNYYYIPERTWIKRYPAGKMLWVLWLNPSAPIETNQYWNSPTRGNNVYVIHIKDIESMGDNWNSLVPLPYDDAVLVGGTPNVNKYNHYMNVFNPDPNPDFDPRLVSTSSDAPSYALTPVPYQSPTHNNYVRPLNKQELPLPNDPHSPLPSGGTAMSVEVGVLPWSQRSYTVTF